MQNFFEKIGFIIIVCLIALCFLNASNAIWAASMHRGIVGISINDVSKNESNGSINFTVSLSDQPASAVTVQFSTGDGTAKAGSDYVKKSGTLTIPAGMTSGTITVTLLDDSIDEDDESFFVNLSNPSANARIDDGQGTATILDDDAPPTVSVNDTSTNEDSATLNFTVFLSIQSGKTVSVNFATNDGSAVAGSDYTPHSGTVTFSPGNTTATISVPLLDDNLDEDDEQFIVSLASPSNATLADGQGTGTIVDDDPSPSLSINDASANEKDGSLTFTVSLSAASGRTVQVDYSTQDSTATANTDYIPNSGTLSFPAGSTATTITVSLIDDIEDEDDEIFTVDLTNPQNAALADAQGEGMIIDDDLPSLSIADTSAAEGAGMMSFTITLSRASQVAVTAAYSVSDGTANAGSDYVMSTGFVNFPAGVTSRTILIGLIDDPTYEPDETFFVQLSSPVNAVLADSIATGTIVNDDVPAISISDAGGDESSDSLQFTVSLSMPIPEVVTVKYTTLDSTARAGSDYTKASGTLTFAANTTGRTLSIAIADDSLDEDDEVFGIVLQMPVKATLADSFGLGTIKDNDPPPSLSIGDAMAVEPDSGTALLRFPVGLSAASGRTVQIEYSTADSSAIAGVDYQPGSGTLTFSPGSTGDTISVVINSDSLSEIDEVFFVNLANPVNATLADAQGRGVIIGDIILSVVLDTFEAVTGKNGVDLSWRTLTETDNAGFHLFKSQKADSGFQQITADLIPGAGTTSTPQSYMFTDTNVVTGETYYYKLGSVHTGGSMYLHSPIQITVGPFTGIESIGAEIPDDYALWQNYPNPFNPQTTIRFALPLAGEVRLQIFNAAGILVRTLVDEYKPAGTYRVRWDGVDAFGRRVASGLYLYRLESAAFTAQRKLILLK